MTLKFEAASLLKEGSLFPCSFVILPHVEVSMHRPASLLALFGMTLLCATGCQGESAMTQNHPTHSAGAPDKSGQKGPHGASPGLADMALGSQADQNVPEGADMSEVRGPKAHTTFPQLTARDHWPPARGWMLSPIQYVRTLQAAFGFDPEVFLPLQTRLEETPGGGEFVFTSELGASQAHTAYMSAILEEGQALLEQAVSSKQNYKDIEPCFPEDADPDKACVIAWMTPIARALYRGPVDPQELQELATLLLEKVAPLYTPTKQRGVAVQIKRFALLKLMLSHHTLYRAEFTDLDPDTKTAHLDAYQWANAVSYFLFDAPPAPWLMTMAAQGELEGLAGKRAAALKMLESPAELVGIHRLFLEMIDAHHLDASHSERDALYYPDFSPSLIGHMRKEAELYTQGVIAQGGNFRDLFLQRKSFLSYPLAKHYGIGVKEEFKSFQPFDLPQDQRRGLLTLAAFTTALGNLELPSPVHRGIFMRERFLCQIMPQAPATADFNAPTPLSHASLRQQLAEHISDEFCATCHQPTDPLGFALDSFDSVGAWRTTEQAYINAKPLPSHPLDTSGTAYVYAGDEGKLFDFKDTLDFIDQLVEEPIFQDCVKGRITQAAAGQVLEGITADPFDDQGAQSLKAFLLEITLHPNFLDRTRPQ